MTAERKAKTDQLAKRVPGFVGYHAQHHLETDWLLRRFLAGQIEKVRDRLADFIAASDLPADLRDRLGSSLRTVARIKDEVTPGKEEEPRREPLSAEGEERLLDLDLALEDKVAALNTPLDALESAGDPAGMNRAAQFFEEGLAEVEALFRQRLGVLAGSEVG